MTTYNTYQEAKIANPSDDIWVNTRGRFGLKETIAKTIYTMHKCVTYDYCMTVESFKSDNHLFADGDLIIDFDGMVKVVNAVNAGWFNSSISPLFSCAFVLRAAALESIPTETPEEKEVLDGIESVGEVEWNGDDLPPVGAIYTLDPNYDIELLCKYSSEYVVVGEMLPEETYRGMEVIVDTMTQRDRTFRKPETPQQREDRERLESAYDLYCSCGIQHETSSFDEWKHCYTDPWLAIVDKTNYRKEKTHGTN